MIIVYCIAETARNAYIQLQLCKVMTACSSMLVEFAIIMNNSPLQAQSYTIKTAPPVSLMYYCQSEIPPAVQHVATGKSIWLAARSRSEELQTKQRKLNKIPSSVEVRCLGSEALPLDWIILLFKQKRCLAHKCKVRKFNV